MVAGAGGKIDIHGLLHHVEHLGHPGTRPGQPGEASVGDGGELCDGPDVVVALELGIDDELELGGVGDVWPDPVEELLLAPGPVAVEGAASRDELVEQHAVGPDVALGREAARLDVLGRGVAEGADDGRGDVREALRGAFPGHAEVGELGVPVLVQEDVGGLEVPEDDLEIHVVVQVAEPPGGVEGDLEAGAP